MKTNLLSPLSEFLFDDFSFFNLPTPMAFGPKVDIVENEVSTELRLELPGFKKEEIKVYFEQGYLVVKGVVDSEKKKENGKYIMKEIVKKDFERYFEVKEDKFHVDKTSLSFEDGILSVTLLKNEVKKKRLELSF